MEDYLSLIDIGSCSLHVVHGAFRTSVQKTSGVLMVYSGHCITYLMIHQQKEKITKPSQDQIYFHCNFVVTDGLKTKKLKRELLVYGLTFTSM